MVDNYSEILEKAYSLHKLGQLDEAQNIYEKFLTIFPNNPDALNLYANLLTQKKEFDKALLYQTKVYEITKLENIKIDIAKIHYFKNDLEKSIRILEEIKEKDEKTLDFLATLYMKTNNEKKALKSYELILKQNKNNLTNLYNISILHSKLGNNEQSIKYIKKVLNIDKNNLEALLHLAYIYEKTNQLDKAIPALEKAFILSNNNESICLKIALISTIRKDYLKAVIYYEKCLQMNQKNIMSLTNLPLILIKIKQFDKALEFCNRAIEISQKDFEVHRSFFEVYKEIQNWEKCIEHAKKMIEIEPNNSVGYSYLAEAYYEAVDYNIAIEYFNKALEFNPDDTDYLYNKACCLISLEKYEDSIKILNKILEIDNEYYHALKSIVNIKFLKKEYETAMNDYNKIMSPEIAYKLNGRIPNDANKFFTYYKNDWNRKNIKDKTLLIYNNAGLGDCIMFSRYIPHITKLAKNVVIEIEENLYELYKENFKNVEVALEKDANYKGYDYTTSCMLLLYNAKLDFNNIPFPEGWLTPNKKLVEKFSKLDIFKTKNKKIGIFWQGNQNILKNRRVPLELLIPLFSNQKFNFYSLDITKKDEKTLNLLEKYKIKDLSIYIKTFKDTAALIENLDLIITIDSSIVHLAGALGKQTFLMLPNNTEWRWFNDTKTTAWYNSVKIFKQTKQNNWQTVIDDIQKELQNL